MGIDRTLQLVIKCYSCDRSGWTSRDFLPKVELSRSPLVHFAGYSLTFLVVPTMTRKFTTDQGGTGSQMP